MYGSKLVESIGAQSNAKKTPEAMQIFLNVTLSE